MVVNPNHPSHLSSPRVDFVAFILSHLIPSFVSPFNYEGHERLSPVVWVVLNRTEIPLVVFIKCIISVNTHLPGKYIK